MRQLVVPHPVLVVSFSSDLIVTLVTKAGPAGSLQDQVSTGHVPAPLAPLGLPAVTIYRPAGTPMGPMFLAPFAGISPRGTTHQGFVVYTTMEQALHLLGPAFSLGRLAGTQGKTSLAS